MIDYIPSYSPFRKTRFTCCQTAVRERTVIWSRIENIYTESYSKSSAAISADGELSEIIREEIVDRLEAPASMTKEYVADLIYAGSSYGQKAGFESGFNYAMSLIFESLVN